MSGWIARALPNGDGMGSDYNVFTIRDGAARCVSRHDRADHAEGASKLHVDNGAGTSTEVRSETGRVLWRVNTCGDMVDVRGQPTTLADVLRKRDAVRWGRDEAPEA
jgi:hypothetical protein